jgi:hypothetical protein
MRQRTGGAVAFLLDAREDGAGVRRPLRMLREAGWTALPVRPGELLADLWRQADRQADRAQPASGEQHSERRAPAHAHTPGTPAPHARRSEQADTVSDAHRATPPHRQAQ